MHLQQSMYTYKLCTISNFLTVNDLFWDQIDEDVDILVIFWITKWYHQILISNVHSHETVYWHGNRDVQ